MTKLKTINQQKSVKKAKTSELPAKIKHNHQHHHSNQNPAATSRPHPLAAFFQCCLGNEPAPLSPKIQKLRDKIPSSQTLEIHLKPGQKITITKDMIIGDVLANFPENKNIFEDIHPLGLLSPLLDQTTIEIFLSDLNIDADLICQSLSKIIAQK